MTQLSNAEFAACFSSFEHTAFRLELQLAYVEPSETAILDAYRNGDKYAHETDPGFVGWWSMLREHTAAGRRIERVRVQEDPPTWYQEWERWLGRWNTAAGEHTRYMTRDDAHKYGLLPAAGDTDWWLFDSKRLVLMRFDGEGRRLETELVTDPTIVVQACAWRDLAVHHSVPATDRA